MPNCKTYGKKYKGGDFYISRKKIDSLEGCPQHITGDFACDNNNNLSNLIGGPAKVDGIYHCQYNQLTDLDGCASHIGDFLNFADNSITSLVGIHKIIKSCKKIWFDPDSIKEGGVGLLLIENLTYISTRNYPSFEIISNYLGTGTKGMMACSKELTEKGYDDYAKL